MKINSKPFAFIVVGAVVTGLFSILLVNDFKEDHQELQLALSYLYQDKIDKASILFFRLEHSLWVKKPARLGSLIASLVNKVKNDDARDIPLPEKSTVNIDDFHLDALLQRVFLSADFDRCAKLAEIARFYGVETADLYYAAALLEKGESTKAVTFYYGLPDSLKDSLLGARLKETFELIKAGVQKIVRDRNGELIGTINALGEFEFYRAEYRRFIQPVMIRNIIKSAETNGIRASIDLELSRSALVSLGENQGSIVLIKPGSGEILAAVSDEKTIQKMGEGSSPAFEEMLEPASISKLITVTAAFRNHLDPETEIAGLKCRGGRSYSGKFLSCSSYRGKLQGLDQAMAISCNTAFAELGVKLGWEKMLGELHLFGFDSTMKNPFSLGKIIVGEGDQRALADLAIGLEDTLVTPVHAALIAAVFANDGSWVDPELVYAADGLTGLSPQRFDYAPRKQILDKEWLPSIRESMRAVTQWEGTASYIAPWDFPVNMKTGTGGNCRDGFHINYIGYGPEDRGSIVFCVRVTGKRSTGRARRDGYEANRKLLILLDNLTQQRSL